MGLTEAEWEQCGDPFRMLEAVRERTSERKLLCIRCAHLRRDWRQRDERYHDLVEGPFAEAAQDWFDRGKQEFLLAVEVMERHIEGGADEGEVEWAEQTLGRYVAVTWTEELWNNYAHDLRCIFGNPFRPPATLDPGVLAWHDGTIPQLARAIHAERAFDRLPILADALEEAGCGDADLLGHLRSAGPHATGCWAVDLVLARE